MAAALPPLTPLPPTLRAPDGGLLAGLFAGRLSNDPLLFGPNEGRRRRWLYAAAGDDRAAVGAAVVDLGFVAAVFAWAVIDGRTHTFDRRAVFGRGTFVGATPDRGAGADGPFGRIRLAGDGSLDLDVPTEAGRLTARVDCTQDVLPVVLATPTEEGGWNVTQKAAGTAMDGWLAVGTTDRVPLEAAGGWRDWTTGRQDRTTRWRWAAGAGWAADGRRVGLNASTGMNAAAHGEDVVWWEGRPYPLVIDRLAPIVGTVPHGRWEIHGAGCALDLDVTGVRARTERLPLLRSTYTQPIGRLEGTLPDPDGTPVEVSLTGVTEDHLAVW